MRNQVKTWGIAMCNTKILTESYDIYMSPQSSQLWKKMFSNFSYYIHQPDYFF